MKQYTHFDVNGEEKEMSKGEEMTEYIRRIKVLDKLIPITDDVEKVKKIRAEIAIQKANLARISK